MIVPWQLTGSLIEPLMAINCPADTVSDFAGGMGHAQGTVVAKASESAGDNRQGVRSRVYVHGADICPSALGEIHEATGADRQVA